MNTLLAALVAVEAIANSWSSFRSVDTKLKCTYVQFHGRGTKKKGRKFV